MRSPGSVSTAGVARLPKQREEEVVAGDEENKTVGAS